MSNKKLTDTQLYGSNDDLEPKPIPREKVATGEKEQVAFAETVYFKQFTKPDDETDPAIQQRRKIPNRFFRATTPHGSEIPKLPPTIDDLLRRDEKLGQKRAPPDIKMLRSKVAAGAAKITSDYLKVVEEADETPTVAFGKSGSVSVLGTEADEVEVQIEVELDHIMRNKETKEGSIYHVYEFLEQQIKNCRSPEKKREIWQRGIKFINVYLENNTFKINVPRDKGRIVVSVNLVDEAPTTDKPDPETHIYRPFMQAYSRTLAPEVRRENTRVAFQLIYSSPYDRKLTFARALMVALSGFMNSSKFEPSNKIRHLVRTHLVLGSKATDVVKDPAILINGFTNPKSKDSKSLIKIVEGLEPLKSQEHLKKKNQSTKVRSAAHDLAIIAQRAANFNLIIEEHIGLLMEKALETDKLTKQDIIDILSTGEEREFMKTKELENYFNDAYKHGIMSDAIMRIVYKGKSETFIMNEEMIRFFVDLIVNRIAKFSDVSEYFTHEGKIKLLERVGDLEQITWEDYEKMCKSVHGKLKEIKDRPGQKRSTLEKVFGLIPGRKKPTLLTVQVVAMIEEIEHKSTIIWENLILPQLVLYGELLFSGSLALPGKPLVKPELRR